jgi:hypothetical protein
MTSFFGLDRCFVVVLWPGVESECVRLMVDLSQGARGGDRILQAPKI